MNKTILRKLLLDNIILSPATESMMSVLTKLDGDSPIEDYGDFIESILATTVSFKPIRITPELSLDNDPAEVAEVLLQYNHYRGKVFPATHEYIYLKLATGGFANYDARINGIGAMRYPILWVTLLYKGKLFNHAINPKGRDSLIHETTVEYLNRNNTLTDSLESQYDIAQIDTMIVEWIKECGIKPQNTNLNQHLHLVSANSEFNKSFIARQLPKLKGVTSLVNVDINHIVNAINTTPYPLPPLNLYAYNREDYVVTMQNYHERFIKGLNLCIE